MLGRPRNIWIGETVLVRQSPLQQTLVAEHAVDLHNFVGKKLAAAAMEAARLALQWTDHR